MSVASEVGVPVSSTSLAAIAAEHDGIFVFYRFHKFAAGIRDLEAVIYHKPGGELEAFHINPDTSVTFDDDGRVRHFSTRWLPVAGQLQPPDIVLACGTRLSLLVGDLSEHFPEHACEGWIRVPDGDITELKAGWATLFELDRFS